MKNNRDLVAGFKAHLEETNKEIERFEKDIRKARSKALKHDYFRFIL